MRELTDRERRAYAHALQANELLYGLLDDILTEAVKAWDATQPHDTEGREQAWMQRQAVKKLTNRIKKLASEKSVE